MASKRPAWMPSTPVLLVSILLLSTFDYVTWTICVGDVNLVNDVTGWEAPDDDRLPTQIDALVSTTLGTPLGSPTKPMSVPNGSAFPAGNSHPPDSFDSRSRNPDGRFDVKPIQPGTCTAVKTRKGHDLLTARS
ncbi:hypothetical protein ISN76_10515 [Dyella halodurans]|uniref:Uncharacterized protein n=1 Tax=Dyella halodurans TaxID=1920171 RepID=A0ABV9C360_9GAMM|nr:hypothetical protein [Dyella halodurans]